jgi:hypothetical protein
MKKVTRTMVIKGMGLPLVVLVFVLMGFFGPGTTPTAAQIARSEQQEARLVQILKESELRRSFQQLSAIDQQLYARIVYALENYQIYLSDVPQQRALAVFFNVMADYPEFFWVKTEADLITKMIGNKPSGHRLGFHYIDDRDREAIATKQQEIDRAVSSILVSVDREATPYEQARYLYQYLILNTTYDEAFSDQSMYSVLTKHRGVCAGYARAYQYLLHQLGIEADFIAGELIEEGKASLRPQFLPVLLPSNHAWNRIKLDGQWYHVDVTSAQSLSKLPAISYRFFCVSDETMSETHRYGGRMY